MSSARENEVTRKSLEYFDQLKTRIEQDSEFNAALNALQDKDKSGWLPDLPISAGSKKTKAIANTIKMIKQIVDANEKHNNDKNHKIVVSRLKHHIDAIKPVQFESVTDGIAYQLFLCQASQTFLLPVDKSALDYAKQKAWLKTNVKQHEHLEKEIESVKELLDRTNYTAVTARLQNEELLQGQKSLHKAIKGLGKTQQKNAEEAKAAVNKLSTLGIGVDDKLQNLLEDSSDIRKKVSMIAQHVIDAAKQKKKEEEIKGLMDAAGFVGALGQHIGSKALCQISTVAQVGIQISNCLTALQSGLGMAALGPMAGIGMGVLKLASAFGKKGEDPNQVILAAIQALATQINNFRIEMHKRFDRIENILFQMHAYLIKGFCDMRYDHKKMLNFLNDIQNDLLKNHEEMKDLFGSLTERIKTLSETQANFARKSQLEKFFKYIHEATGPFKIEGSDFKRLYGEMKPDISLLHQNDSTLVGDRNLSQATLVDRLEADENNLFASEFNIRSLSDALSIAPSLGLVNPAVWSWQLIGFMELLNRYYKHEEKPNRQITHAELKELHKIRPLGKDTQSFTLSLRQPDLLKKLHSDYIDAAIHLEAELKNYVGNEEKLVTRELNQTYAQTIERFDHKAPDSRQPPSFEIFLAEKIPLNIQPVGHWFTGNHKLDRKTRKGADEVFNVAIGPENGHIKTRINDYKSQVEKSIETFKHSYVSTIQGKLGNYQNSYHYFSNPTLSGHYHYAFVLPKHKREPLDPILPIAKNYHSTIPEVVRQAEWLQLGNIEFKYDIVDSNFILETYFTTNTHSNLISTLTTAFNPGPYSKAEGIWAFWVGGISCFHNHAPRTLLYENGWDRHWAYIPELKNFPGRRNEIVKTEDKLTNAVEVMAPLDEKELQSQIQEKQVEFKKTLMHKLKNEITSNSESKLGKSFTAYAYNFYKLKSSLILAYGEDNVKKVSQFNILFDRNLLTNRIRFVELMKRASDLDEPPSFIDLFSQTLSLMRSDIPLGIEAIQTIEVSPTYLEEVLERWDELMEWYNLHAIDENELCNTVAVEEMQKEQIKNYKGILRLLNKAFAACGNVTQQEMLDALTLVGDGNPLTTQLLTYMHPGEEKSASSTKTRTSAKLALVSSADSSSLSSSASSSGLFSRASNPPKVEIMPNIQISQLDDNQSREGSFLPKDESHKTASSSARMTGGLE